MNKYINNTLSSFKFLLLRHFQGVILELELNTIVMKISKEDSKNIQIVFALEFFLKESYPILGESKKLADKLNISYSETNRKIDWQGKNKAHGLIKQIKSRLELKYNTSFERLVILKSLQKRQEKRKKEAVS